MDNSIQEEVDAVEQELTDVVDMFHACELKYRYTRENYETMKIICEELCSFVAKKGFREEAQEAVMEKLREKRNDILDLSKETFGG